MQILVCEDDFMLLRTIEHKLKQENYDVVTVKDGKKALEVLKEVDISLIITDLQMPFISGLELINELRGNQNCTIPIIVLSKLGSEDTVLKAFELGADDYITKPFSPSELMVRVRRQLSRRR